MPTLPRFQSLLTQRGIFIQLLPFHENGHLFYTLSDPSGATLIGQTQVSDNGLRKTNHPVIQIDQSDIAHIIWADHAGTHSIMYTALDAYATAPFSGQNSTDESLSLINDTVLVMRNQNRGNPHFVVDSVDNLHLVWEDRYDELEQTMTTSNVYYKLLNPNIANRSLEILVDDSIIAVSPLESSGPQVVLSSSDVPTVLWQEPSRDHGLEMVFVMDTSGSMYSEWDDVCTLIYGGNFASGGYFQGMKPMFNDSDVTIYETIYGLGDTLPAAASSSNCQSHNKNAGPRPTPLGQTSGDDSGGLRKLPATIYNGNTYSGYSGEDWGPSEPIGLVFLGKIPLETSRVTPQQLLTTAGTPMQRKLSFRFLMRVQKTATLPSKPMM